MNLISTWLDFWSKVLSPDFKIRECYFCHGGIPPLDIPLYVLLEDSDTRVPACCYCFSAHKNPKDDIIEYVNASNSTPKEVEIAVSTSLTRKLKIK